MGVLKQRASMPDHRGASRVLSDVIGTNLRVSSDDAYTCLCIHHKSSVISEHLYMAMRRQRPFHGHFDINRNTELLVSCSELAAMQ